MRFLRVLFYVIVIVVIMAFIMGVDNVVLQKGTADMSPHTTQSAQ